MRVRVPDASQFDKMVAFSREISEFVQASEYEFDFANVAFVTPAWLVIVGSALRRFRDLRPNTRRRAINFKHLGYAAHVGFFKYFGVQFGRAPSEADGSDTYVPLTEISVHDLKSRSASAFVPAGEIIEEEAENLATLLTRRNEGDLFETLVYSIREIVRNVVEHSDADSYIFAAQYWPTQHTAEVAVADRGCGILASLRENPRLQIDNDADALKLALLPGISSKSWRRSQQHDEWANSGYGLFMTQRLCSIGGEFGLISGEHGLRITEANAELTETKTPGTTVVLRLNTARLGQLSNRLQEFRKEGRELAAKAEHADHFGPSLASLILRPTNHS